MKFNKSPSPCAIAILFAAGVIQFAAGQTVDLQSLKASAAAGDVAAQYELGRRYELGSGTIQDDSLAARWYRRAAEARHAPAQSKLGRMYASGRGVVRSQPTALRWFFRAAAQGDGGAMNMLGRMYAEGRGVRRDRVEAHRWFSLAIQGGNAIEAEGNRLALCALMSADELALAELNEAWLLVGGCSIVGARAQKAPTNALSAR